MRGKWPPGRCLQHRNAWSGAQAASGQTGWPSQSEEPGTAKFALTRVARPWQVAAPLERPSDDVFRTFSSLAAATVHDAGCDRPARPGRRHGRRIRHPALAYDSGPAAARRCQSGGVRQHQEARRRHPGFLLPAHRPLRPATKAAGTGRWGTARRKSTRTCPKATRAARGSSCSPMRPPVQQILTVRRERSQLNTLEQAILRNCYFARGAAFYELEGSMTRSPHTPPRPIDITMSRKSSMHFCSLPSVIASWASPTKQGMSSNGEGGPHRIPDDASFKQTTIHSRQEWPRVLDWLAEL